MKNIPHPQLDSATEMTAADENRIRFSGKHTVLTPQTLDQEEKEAR